MEAGKAQIKATAWGFFFFGLSYKHLFFTNSGGKKSIILHNSDYPRNAYRCANCHSIFIEGN
jgi:hypothetical protein